MSGGLPKKQAAVGLAAEVALCLRLRERLDDIGTEVKMIRSSFSIVACRSFDLAARRQHTETKQIFGRVGAR